jgi:predicted phage-related endonuclease
MDLSPKARAQGIGGSDARRIWEGDWLTLWEEKTQKRPPEDLSRVLPVQMGTWTEPYNLAWYQKETGNYVEPGAELREYVHPKRAWMRCHVDGLVMLDAGSAVWEAKHVNPFQDMEDVASAYWPQLQHNMEVTGFDMAILSVFFGNTNYAQAVYHKDHAFLDELMKLEEEFWQLVVHDLEPVGKHGKPAIDFSKMRVVSMEGNNAWAVHEEAFAGTLEAVARHEAAGDELKKLIPADAELAYGEQVCVRRTKAGALYVRTPLKTDMTKIQKHKDAQNVEDEGVKG